MKRKNGEGSWGKKIIKGKEYKYYRNSDGKYFYGKTEKEIKVKIKEYQKKTTSCLNSDETYLGDFMKDWLFKIKYNQVKQRTFDAYEKYYELLILHYQNYVISDIKLSNLTPKILTTYFNSLAENYSMSTIKKAQTLLTQCMNYAVDEELIANNPMLKVRMPSKDKVAIPKKEIPFLSPNDMEKLYLESNRTQEQGFKINGNIGDLVYGNNAKIIILIMYTGLRIAEMQGLKWKDVDFENKCIYINRNLSQIKNREDNENKYVYVETSLKKESSKRTIPLSNRAYEILSYLHDNNTKTSDDDYVCLNKNGKIAQQRNITRTLNAMLVRAKCDVQKCGLHSLRHSFGSYLVSEGIDIATVSKLMGHKDITTTYNVYIHVLQQKQIDAINVFNKNNKKEG